MLKQQPVNHTPLASQAPGQAVRQQASRPRAATAATAHASEADPTEIEQSTAGLQKALEAVVDTNGLKAAGESTLVDSSGLC